MIFTIAIYVLYNLRSKTIHILYILIIFTITICISRDLVLRKYFISSRENKYPYYTSIILREYNNTR
jgi:membrane-bound acyltransferase YfiQ involved in biofilm formation